MEKYGFKWDSISVSEIDKYHGKKDIMCLCGDESFFIEKTDVKPDYIRFDFVINGQWYIKD